MNSPGNLVPLQGRNDLAHPASIVGMRPLVDDEGERSGFWAALHRNRGIILGLALLGLLAGALIAYLTPPTYRAEAALEFENGPNPAGADDFVNSQVRVLESRALAEKVVNSLKLQNNARAIAALGLPGGTKTEAADLVGRVHDGVDAELADGSNTAAVAFSSRDPAASALIANGFANVYLQTNLERQQNASEGVRGFLEQRVASTKADLAASEKALINYTRSAGLIDPSAGTASVSGDAAPRSLASDKLAQMTQAYSQARADRIIAEQRWREAQRTPVSSLPEVLNNPAIQQLTQRSAEAQAAIQQQRQRRQDGHPELQGANAQAGEIDRQVQAIGASVKRSIQERYQVAVRQEQDLAGAVNRLQSQTLSDQGKGVGYNRLKREADSKRQLYNALLQRLNDTTVQSGQYLSYATVIDPATPPADPTSPKPALWTLLGGAMGLLLGLAYLLIAWLRDEALYSPESAARKLQLRVLGVLPRVKHPSDALLDPRSPLSEAHYALRGSLEAGFARGAPRTILFTSSREGEGKSTAAWGVARDFALSGRRTLLVDADMRKPSVQNYVGVTSPLGLSTVLAGLSAVEASVMHSGTPDLDVMLAGPMPASPAALLSGKELKALLQVLENHYELVIIDAPPVLGLADAPRMAAVVQRTIFVVEAGRTGVPDIRGALRRLIEFKAKFAGVVLTKFDATQTSSSNLYVYDYGERPQKRLEALGAQ
ncbi:MAG TPA: polysaccharide biosynthesis tyrosine autokinase [Sphingomicrobium sp.]|nr:polysaccharide biosynthesis tyrosine autokinase [Sphingomicrobium sp.]